MRLLAAALLVPPLCACVALAGDGVNRGWFVWEATGWLYGGGDPIFWEREIETQVGQYYEIDSESLTVVLDLEAGHDPITNLCNLPSLITGLQGARTYFIGSHGGLPPFGDLYVELWKPGGATPITPWERVSDLEHAYTLSSPGDIDWRYLDDLGGGEGAGVGIYLTAVGGVDKIARNTQPGFILFGMYCYSSISVSSWGVGAVSPGSPSMLAYEGTVTGPESDADLWDVLYVFACRDNPRRGNTFAEIVSVNPTATWSGWPDNRVHPGWSCHNIAGLWYHTSAHTGEVRMAYVGEDSASIYHVLADGDTVATFDGRGTDGYGRLRCYSASVPTAAQCFHCVEVDDLGRPTYSEEFTWSDESEEWEALQPLDDLTLAEVDSALGPPAPDDPWEPDDPGWDWVAARDEWLSGQGVEWVDHGSYRQLIIGPAEECPMCGDVLIYKVAGTPFSLPTVYYQITNYFTDKKVVAVEGETDDPAEAREVLWTVAHFNAQYGGGQYPVDPGPTLILLGDAYVGGVQMMHLPDNAAQSCTQQTSCESYSLIGDIYGEDGIPDCPVQAIPAFTDEELSKQCMFAWRWNHGADVNINGGGLFLLWDWHGVEPYSGMTPVTLRIRDAYCQASAPTMLLRRSEYGMCQGPSLLIEAVEDAFASRPRDVWCLGHTGDLEGKRIPWLEHDWFTHNFIDLDTNQVVMMIAPTCGSARHGAGTTASVSRHMLVLAEPDETRAAGFLGQLNSAYDCEHADFAWAFRNALGNAPEGATYDLVTHDAITTMAQQNPHYALGVQWLGSLTKVRGDLPPGTSVPEPRSVQAGSGLWASRGERGTDFHFALSEGADIRLTVLDVQGRVVARVREGWHAPGQYTYTWFQKDQGGRPVPNGVYFGRLEVGGSSGKPQSAQVTVAR